MSVPDKILEQLAKRAYGAGAAIVIRANIGSVTVGHATGDDSHSPLQVNCARPREALLGALLTMVSDGSEAAMFDSGRRFEHAQAWYLWQEQLARDLEVICRALIDAPAHPDVDGAAVRLAACIETLRARGRGVRP